MRLSVAMIVRNEELVVERALQSVKDFDEIIVVDTGSIDRTKDVISKYTDKIYDFKWVDDFSAARNEALSHCTGDWVLSLDADEWLDGANAAVVKDEIEKAEKTGFDSLLCNLYYGEKKSHQAARIFKRDGVKFQYVIHEYPTVQKSLLTNLRLTQLTSPTHSMDMNRNLRILEKAVKDNPKLARYQYHLATEYFWRSNWIAAIYWFENYLRMSNFLWEATDAHLYLARCYAKLPERGEAARNHCIQAIKYNPEFKEAILFMAELVSEKHAKRWKAFAEGATNEEVLFQRVHS